MKHAGNLRIETKDDAKKYAKVTEVSGSVDIYAEGASLPALVKSGYVEIRAGGASLPALAEVSGSVYIRAGGASLPALVKSGSVYIRAEGASLPALVKSGSVDIYAGGASLPALAELSGSVYIRAEGASLPALVKSGSVDIYAEGASLPALAEVSGSVYIRAGGASLPALAEVSGSVDIYAEGASLPALAEVSEEILIHHSSAKFNAPELYAKGFDNFKVYDGIGCVVLSSKKKDEIEILSCRHAKVKKQRIIGEKFFVAKKGNHTAHAADLKTALEELQFKLGDRNIDQYRNIPSHTRKSPQDWAFVYRMVTGACQFGVKNFMERKGKLKKTYTLAEILEETKGAFGHEKFRQVVAP